MSFSQTTGLKVCMSKYEGYFVRLIKFKKFSIMFNINIPNLIKPHINSLFIHV